MIQETVCFWSEVSSVTLTSNLKKELFVAAEGTRTGQVWKILQVDPTKKRNRSRWTDVLLRALQ